MTDSAVETLPVPAPARPRDAAPSLRDLVRDFRGFGQASIETLDGGVPYLVNEFWTAGQRRGHALHEVSSRLLHRAADPPRRGGP
jgi:hypothetical protein